MNSPSVSFSSDKYEVKFCIERFQTYQDYAEARWCDMFVSVKNNTTDETVGGEEICSDEVVELRIFLDMVLDGTAIGSEYNPYKLCEEPWTFRAISENEYILEFIIPTNDKTGKYRYSGELKNLKLNRNSVEIIRDYVKEITKEQPLDLVLD